MLRRPMAAITTRVRCSIFPSLSNDVDEEEDDDDDEEDNDDDEEDDDDEEEDNDDDGLPAYSHHDKIPPWWGNVSNDKGGNVSVSNSHHS